MEDEYRSHMVNEYRVSFRKAEASWIEDKWILYFPNGGANSYDTKKEAVKEGRELAKARKPAELIIERKDGTVNKINNYGFR